MKTFISGLLKGGITSRNLLAASVIGAALVAGQLSAWADKTPFSEIVIFGDSLSDDGNGLYKLTGGAQPASPYWEGRFSNGPVWPEYLAVDLGMTALLDDYAVAGATSGSQVLGAPADWPHGVKSQIEQYLSSHQGDPDALYILWAGHNDIFIPLFSQPMGDLDAARVAFVGNMKNNIKTLWAAGARHIVVVNIADIGKTPPVEPAFSAWLSGVAAGYNAGLATVLHELAAEGVPTIALDAFAIVGNVVAHPEQFGFVNVTVDPFPDNPSGYAYFGGHPSTVFHQLVAQFAARALIEYFSPSQGKGTPPAQVNALNGLVQAGKPGKGH